MSKSNKYSQVIKRRINFLFCSFLVIIIAFSNFTDYPLFSDFESESIENFVDVENENKEQEKLEKLDKDVLLSMSTNMKWYLNAIAPHSNQEHTKLYNLHTKKPTPPPDFF